MQERESYTKAFPNEQLDLSCNNNLLNLLFQSGRSVGWAEIKEKGQIILISQLNLETEIRQEGLKHLATSCNNIFIQRLVHSKMAKRMIDSDI